MNALKRLPVILPLLAMCAHCHASAVVVADGGMRIRVSPSGVAFSLAKPEFYNVSTNFIVPRDFSPAWSPLAQWPGGTKEAPVAAAFAPRYDDDGSIILGGAFRQLQPESVVIKPVGGTEAFINGRDYILNTEWAQFAALDGRLGTPGADRIDVAASIAMQRIDLVQVDAAGAPSVKQGVSRLACPRRPDPDPGCRALAGVYIAPWRRGGVWTVTQDDILHIHLESPLVPPRHPEAARETLAKLRAGKDVKIAFIGDSLTLGAEAGPWWRDDSTTYRGRVMRALRARFPTSAIQEIQAFQGGRGVDYAHEAFTEIIEPAKPDLIVLGIGVNDAHAEQAHKPAVPLEQFEPRFDELIERAKALGTEVIVHTSMETNPFDVNGDAQRWHLYRGAILRVAERHGIGIADTWIVWQNLRLCGIPPHSQLHNWINHPGADGHKLFSDSILQFFPNPEP
ncbi:MAG: SGNH/GDSL hydrolase family protein [Kiritimatiellia bacterium]|jgi:lysophospholipase L1-like esterase